MNGSIEPADTARLFLIGAFDIVLLILVIDVPDHIMRNLLLTQKVPQGLTWIFLIFELVNPFLELCFLIFDNFLVVVLTRVIIPVSRTINKISVPEVHTAPDTAYQCSIIFPLIISHD